MLGPLGSPKSDILVSSAGNMRHAQQYMQPMLECCQGQTSFIQSQMDPSMGPDDRMSLPLYHSTHLA